LDSKFKKIVVVWLIVLTGVLAFIGYGIYQLLDNRYSYSEDIKEVEETGIYNTFDEEDIGSFSDSYNHDEIVYDDNEESYDEGYSSGYEEGRYDYEPKDVYVSPYEDMHKERELEDKIQKKIDDYEFDRKMQERRDEAERKFEESQKRARDEYWNKTYGENFPDYSY